MSRRQVARHLLAAVVVVHVVSGCAVAQPDSADPWAAEFAEAREFATSELQREVLEDGQITDAEFHEVEQDVVRCVADQGYELTVIGGGNGYELTMPGGMGFVDEVAGGQGTAARDECFRDRFGAVESLYWTIRINPENVDLNTLVAECLVRAAVVDPPFSGQDYGESLSNPTYDLSDPRVDECLTDPSRAFDG